MAIKNEPIAYLLCYTVRVNHGSTDIDTDQWEVFAERVNDLSPIQQADRRLKEIQNEYENSPVAVLYTWNIAKVVKTNEWYTTSH